MRIYISGKITGLEPREWKVKFLAAQTRIEDKGHKAINPIHMSNYDLTREMYMEFDHVLLTTCDAIYMLDNWRDSEGARQEKVWAEELGLDVLYENRGITQKVYKETAEQTLKSAT